MKFVRCPSLRRRRSSGPQADQDCQVERSPAGHIELTNGPMLFEYKTTPAEYTAILNWRSSAAGW
jgi:hypothetical protein